ncbi:hypothetical protein ACFLRY_05445, partial [Bacteroidota bacterium]
MEQWNNFNILVLSMKHLKHQIHKYKLQPLLAVFWFCLITIVIHILWRLWAYRTHYWPIEEEMRT